MFKAISTHTARQQGCHNTPQQGNCTAISFWRKIKKNLSGMTNSS